MTPTPDRPALPSSASPARPPDPAPPSGPALSAGPSRSAAPPLSAGPARPAGPPLSAGPARSSIPPLSAGPARSSGPARSPGPLPSRGRPGRPAAVLFDCDGVLVDSEPFAGRAVQADLAARGLDLPLAEVEHRFTGSTMDETRRSIEAEGLALPADWSRSIYDRLYAELARGVAPIPGIEAALEALARAGIPCAVGSNGEPEKMRITLGQHPRLLRHFNGHLYSGQALGRVKPDPEVYLHAARALGVAPEACVVVEDSRFGCMAGMAAGMRTLGYAPRDAGTALAALGAEVFHDMHALPALLGL